MKLHILRTELVLFSPYFLQLFLLIFECREKKSTLWNLSLSPSYLCLSFPPMTMSFFFLHAGQVPSENSWNSEIDWVSGQVAEKAESVRKNKWLQMGGEKEFFAKRGKIYCSIKRLSLCAIPTFDESPTLMFNWRFVAQRAVKITKSSPKCLQSSNDTRTHMQREKKNGETGGGKQEAKKFKFN